MLLKRPKQNKIIENLYAAPGEFFYVDGTPFEGYYHMSDLKIKNHWEGGEWSRDAKPIVETQLPEFLPAAPNEYSNLQQDAGKVGYPSRSTPVPKTIIPAPSVKDYEKGEFFRFFVVKFNTLEVWEIDEDQFKFYNKKVNPYNNNYGVAKLNWFLTGPILTQYAPNGYPLETGLLEKNKEQIRLTLEDIPQLGGFLTNPLIYTSPTAQNELYTAGKQFKLSNGQDYIGYYHVHSTLGPMEGSYHTGNSHSKLTVIM